MLYSIAYSGHAYVCIEVAQAMGYEIKGYFDNIEQIKNPFQLTYLGKENQNIDFLKDKNYFVGIGNNKLRFKIVSLIATATNNKPINLIHPSAIISKTAIISDNGILIMPNVVINAFSQISEGVILNTSAVIEHECSIGSFAHIAPGVVLCGNVNIGDNTFIGANSVVKQGVIIGDNVTIGAGAVVISNIPNNCTVVGNPARTLKN
ncbi:MAG: acetyltransferase [Saprospiraceae bacterium]|nr:acetyltransferase [Saprospiraceae bacterium]